MWGTVPSVDHPSRPPWYPANDYCKFVQAADGWGGDGDFDFHIEPDWARTGSSFWTDGWLDRELGSLPANSYILQQFSNYGFFNCEAPMYARENTKSVSDCSGPPRMLLPAWFEQGGNSILVNGRPINGNVVDIVDGSGAKALQFNLGPRRQEVVRLTAGATVRVTGVVADDTGHDNPPPEIHPLYAIDVVHVVRRIVGPPVTGGPSLTGAWHADDIGTYYLRQLGNTVWWLGLSSDQGRTFATVFHGSLAGGTISGEWIDVPMGQEPQLGNGTLGVSGGTLATVLRAQSSGYRAATWTKLYDVLPPPPVFEP
jgi:hypothetical protein